jgi:hypothetical protein
MTQATRGKRAPLLKQMDESQNMLLNKIWVFGECYHQLQGKTAIR